MQKNEAIHSNGARSDNLQAKLAALLDNVTVGAELLPGPAPGEPPPPANSAENATEAQPAPPSLAATPEVSQLTEQIKTIQSMAQRVSAPPARAAQAGAPPAPGALNIKGRSEGVAIELGIGNWAELIEQLGERLAHAANFFRGGSVALDVGARPLLESELKQVLALLEANGMKLGVVRTSAERTFEAAIALGVPAKLENTDGLSEAESESAASNHAGEHYFVYRGNLRSGQVLERSEHIMVVGDVNPGAEVVSQGDILVWGRLRGMAHAGAAGDRRALVVALNLDPIQLRIAGVVSVTTDQQNNRAAGRWSWKSETGKRPEVAYLANDQIAVEPWNETKPGGLAAFRR
jgi:septum site-determining protein MinC